MEKQKLRILQVHNAYQIPGGEDVVVANEKKLLEMYGNEVITYSRNNTEINEMNAVQKLLIPFSAVYSFKTYREVKKIIQENHIDVVHVHNSADTAQFQDALPGGILFPWGQNLRGMFGKRITVFFKIWMLSKQQSPDVRECSDS